MNKELKKKLKELGMKKNQQLFGETESALEIQEFANLFLEDASIFTHLHDAYRHQLDSLEVTSQGVDIFYRKEQELHTISFLDKRFSLDDASYVFFLTYSIDLMREVLPLGTVVELDPRYFIPGESASEPIKVVITGRFIFPETYHSYFPYAGVVYPFGELNKRNTIHFTYPLIQKVVHMGYQDEMEESYDYLMKEELILEKGITSIEFSDKDMRRIQNLSSRGQVSDHATV
ncbi:DUF4176 domain-containing protein [Bacillus sp. RAR_GA_16]|uniref:DUF4176 domain-containing protein n=1 Tax=Bacillus sp. RAR_GA_16 TaxID=2876774 RepID=UPI001CC944EC|nr:DUF4176 domain-containing protein [Bacillus sp. RAR_GA_16]MCA0174653.1 DUF4176 domain-containing protein [Bacillus sp. RAR_GA_16]